jgi:hypothetical protein
MSEKDYYESLRTFYEDRLRTQLKDKFSICENCSERRQFIDKPDKLIYTCGSKSGKCGPQMTIHLARYMNYPEMKAEISNLSNNYIDKSLLKEVFTLAEIKEQTELIRESISLWNKSRKPFSQQNQLKERETLIKQTHTRRIQLKKEQNLLMTKIGVEDDDDKKQNLIKEYIQLNQLLKEDYELLLRSNKIINPFLIVEDGSVTKQASEYKELPKKKEPKKKEPKKKEPKEKEPKEKEPKKKEPKEKEPKEKEPKKKEPKKKEPKKKEPKKEEVEEEEPEPSPEEPKFKQGDQVEWTERGKQETGTIDKIVTKAGKEIAEIRTSDGKDITRPISHIKILE